MKQKLTQENRKSILWDHSPQISIDAHSIICALALAEECHVHRKEFLKQSRGILQESVGLLPSTLHHFVRNKVHCRQWAWTHHEVSKL